MSSKAMTLAVSLLVAATSHSFAGSTSALDIERMERPAKTVEQPVAPAKSGSLGATTVRSAKLEKILRDCRFVTNPDAGYCNFFQTAND